MIFLKPALYQPSVDERQLFIISCGQVYYTNNYLTF